MILKEVRNNKISSYFIISVFVIVVMLIVYYVCIYLDLGILSILIAVLFASISAFASYYNSDKIILSLNGARMANEEQDKLLSTVLDNLCIASGLPRPKLYVIEDTSPNAFATGRNPENAVICVTTGLLEKMNKYELEGVIAHELSHIKNYDILLSTVVSVFVGFVVIIADLIFRIGFRQSDSNNKSNGFIQIIGLIFLILSPIFATLMQLAISRKREFLADSSSVEMTRNPDGLISALKKLSEDDSPLESANKATAHMFIVNPLNKGENEKTNLFSTHPPLEERVKHLENIK